MVLSMRDARAGAWPEVAGARPAERENARRDKPAERRRLVRIKVLAMVRRRRAGGRASKHTATRGTHARARTAYVATASSRAPPAWARVA